MKAQLFRLNRIAATLFPRPGAEILTEGDYPTAEALREACQTAKAHGSAIIVDDIPRSDRSLRR
jgi:hypothetical protein